MSSTDSNSMFPDLSEAHKALKQKPDPQRIRDILSFVFKKLEVEDNIQKVDLENYGYHSHLKCFMFNLDFIKPKTDFFGFLNHLNLESKIYLYVDNDLNFHSLEFGYSMRLSPVINGWQSLFTTTFFNLIINYNSSLSVIKISYIFNNSDTNITIIKNESMLCPAVEESCLIELFFQDPELVKNVISSWYDIGAHDYNDLNIAQSTELVRMLNI